MPQKKQVALAKMKVGIMVTISLLILALLVLQQSWGIAWFARSFKVIAYLPDVGGLKNGAPVWLAGMEIGRVRKVTMVPPEVYAGNAPIFREIEETKKQIAAIDFKLPKTKQLLEELQNHIRDLKTEIRMVEIQLDIRPRYFDRISRDSEVSIGSKGLIGDSFIEISPGTYGVPPDKRGDFYLIEGIQRPGFREIMTGANDVIANFGVLSEQFKNVAAKIKPEKIGAGISDTIQDMRQAIQQATLTLSKATALFEEMRRGKGTFGKVVTDPSVYDNLSQTLDNLNKFAGDLRSGSGTIPKLVNDATVYNSASEILKKAERIMERIEKGEGALGKLSKNDELYENATKALKHIASLTDQIDQGQGTLGKLLKDPGLYNNLDQSTAEMSKFIYDLRKDPKKYLTIRVRVF